MVLDGYMANAVWGRVRVPAKPHVGGSRAIRVTGHPFVVNTEHLLSYLNAHFHFNLEGMRLVHRGYATATVDIEFASFTNQAENAFRLIRLSSSLRNHAVYTTESLCIAHICLLDLWNGMPFTNVVPINQVKMNRNNTVPFITQRNGNSAQAVGGPSRGPTMAEHLRRLHNESPSQEETHPTLTSLVRDSEPLTPVSATADGARQLDTTRGPNNSTLLAPPAAPRSRPQASRTQIARALQHVPVSYQGNLMAADNLSANIHPRQNCSLFVRNLPPDLSYEQFFTALRGIGRIVSDRATAERLKAKIDRKQLVISGFTANALCNKIKVAAQPPGPDGGSRVVRVTGRPDLMNEDHLLSYFAAHFFFELDGVPKVVHRGYNSASMEFAFAAFVNQAENAYRLLTQDLGHGRGFGRGRGRRYGYGRGRGSHHGLFGGIGRDLTVAYVRDPCEEGADGSS
ncbi:uncharacterized protein PG986_000724 [Apiospora aurea]|uniref:RRM domain-containing protein n=1 Tax=Apiospora aurea TaxID=335848 RepID=A0ABR1QUU4_9PEZI